MLWNQVQWRSIKTFNVISPELCDQTVCTIFYAILAQIEYIFDIDRLLLLVLFWKVFPNWNWNASQAFNRQTGLHIVAWFSSIFKKQLIVCRKNYFEWLLITACSIEMAWCCVDSRNHTVHVNSRSQSTWSSHVRQATLFI